MKSGWKPYLPERFLQLIGNFRNKLAAVVNVAYKERLCCHSVKIRSHLNIQLFYLNARQAARLKITLFKIDVIDPENARPKKQQIDGKPHSSSG